MGREAPTPAERSKPRPTLTLCIPAYNEERNISRLLDFLRSHPARNATLLEVIVDVSGSTDATPEIVRSYGRKWPAVRLVDVAARDGLLRALDRMIQLAEGEFVIRIDADVRLAPDTLDLLVVELGSARVGIASPRVTPERSRSALADLASSAEWELHHQVSLREPKTTLVQAFRRLPIHLPVDSGLEDAGLQEQVVALGYTARYVPAATVSIRPPPTIRGVLLQRIRTIEHTRAHLRQGYSVPSTASVRSVWAAFQQLLKDPKASKRGLVLFGVVEVFSRVVALGLSVLPPQDTFAWEPVEGTKDFDWTSPSS